MNISEKLKTQFAIVANGQLVQPSENWLAGAYTIINISERDMNETHVVFETKEVTQRNQLFEENFPQQQIQEELGSLYPENHWYVVSKKNLSKLIPPSELMSEVPYGDGPDEARQSMLSFAKENLAPQDSRPAEEWLKEYNRTKLKEFEKAKSRYSGAYEVLEHIKILGI